MLLGAGLLAIVGYGAYHFIVDNAVSVSERTAVAVTVVGLIALLLSVLRQRLNERKGDKYKDVQI